VILRCSLSRAGDVVPHGEIRGWTFLDSKRREVTPMRTLFLVAAAFGTAALALFGSYLDYGGSRLTREEASRLFGAANTRCSGSVKCGGTKACVVGTCGTFWLLPGCWGGKGANGCNPAMHPNCVYGNPTSSCAASTCTGGATGPTCTGVPPCAAPFCRPKTGNCLAQGKC